MQVWFSIYFNGHPKLIHFLPKTEKANATCNLAISRKWINNRDWLHCMSFTMDTLRWQQQANGGQKQQYQGRHWTAAAVGNLQVDCSSHQVHGSSALRAGVYMACSVTSSQDSHVTAHCCHWHSAAEQCKPHYEIILHFWFRIVELCMNRKNLHDDQNLSKWFLNKLILSAITTSFGKLFQVETTLLVK